MTRTVVCIKTSGSNVDVVWPNYGPSATLSTRGQLSSLETTRVGHQVAPLSPSQSCRPVCDNVSHRCVASVWCVTGVVGLGGGGGEEATVDHGW